MYGKETGKNIFERDSSQQKVCDFLSFENNVPFRSCLVSIFLFCCQIIVIKMERYPIKVENSFLPRNQQNREARPGKNGSDLSRFERQKYI